MIFYCIVLYSDSHPNSTSDSVLFRYMMLSTGCSIPYYVKARASSRPVWLAQLFVGIESVFVLSTVIVVFVRLSNALFFDLLVFNCDSHGVQLAAPPLAA